jgi:hypothetical protein
VIVGPDDKVKLVDFGIARHFAPHGPMTMIGTPGYAAPEQYQGKAGPMSDVFALGALMHQMLSGRDPSNNPPFSFPPIGSLCRCEPQLASLISDALIYDAAKRGPSAADFYLSLISIEDGAGLRPNAPTTKLAPPPRAEGSGGYKGPAVLLFVLLFGLLYEFFSILSSAPDNTSDAPTAATTVVDMEGSIRVDDLQYHVKDVEIRSSVGEDTTTFLNAPPDARFIVITYMLTNEGNESQSVPFEKVEIEDARGRKFKSDPHATIDQVGNRRWTIQYSDIQPGIPSELTEVFVLPKNALASKLMLEIRSENEHGASGGIVLKVPKDES